MLLPACLSLSLDQIRDLHNRALTLDPTRVKSVELQGYIQQRLGQMERAAQLYRRAMVIANGRPMPYLFRDLIVTTQITDKQVATND